MNRDQLGSVNPFQALRGMYALVSAGQEFRGAEQVVAASVYFLLMCEQLKLDPSEELHRATRVIERANLHYVEHVRAARQYITEQIGNKS
jgi:hypothetical protein